MKPSPHAWLGIDEVISRKHCRAQFDMLKAEFETLFVSPQTRGQAGQAPAPAVNPATQLAQEIIEQHKTPQDPETLDWPTVYTFHRCILSMLPDADLQRAAWALRERYREMFGEREYADYLTSKPPELNGPEYKPALVLADLDRLLELMYTNYLMGPDNSWLLRRRVRATMITIGIGLAILGLLLAFVLRKHFAGATLLTVGMVGSMGGFVSVLQRLRQLGGSGDALTDYHEIQSVRYTTVFVAGVIGALFAGVLYLLFAGGLIQGQLFPKLGPEIQAQTAADAQESPAPRPLTPATDTAGTAQPQAGGQSPAAVVPSTARQNTTATTAKPPAEGQASRAAKESPAASIETGSKKTAETPAVTPGGQAAAKPSVFTFLAERRPRGHTDVALLILWAFLAGFFERLVPDQLNRLLAKKAEQA